MKKVAVYVEGMTELVFVYHAIHAYYQSDWTAFHLDYVKAYPSDPIDLQRPYGDDAADRQYLLYNCSSDGSVIPNMKDRFQSHLLQGFTAVVGLQDIYGSRYFDEFKATHQHIDWPKVNAMMSTLDSTIGEIDPTGTLKIRFSIMEIESWVLAMPDLLAEAFPGADLARIAAVDPENSYVHPFGVLRSIVPYNKSFSSVEGLFCHMRKKHLDGLLQSGKCASFARFYKCLFE